MINPLFSVFSNPAEFSITLTRISRRTVVVSSPYFDTNQLAVCSDKGIILVDTGISPEYGQAVRDTLEHIFHTERFIYVINTHHHWDHVQGNQVFPDAAIIGHYNCRGAMLKQMPMPITEPAIQKETQGELPPPPPSHILIPGKNGYVVTPPDIAFKDRLEINAGGIRISVLYYGRCHTDNDIIVSFPGEHIVATGDLFYQNTLPPFGNRKNLGVMQWTQALNTVFKEQRVPFCVVPGHGALFTDSGLRLYMDYIERLWKGIGNDVQNRISLESIQKKWRLSDAFPALRNKDAESSTGKSRHRGNVEILWQQHVNMQQTEE